MSKALRVLAFVLLALSVYAIVFAEELTPEQKLKAENFKLRVVIAQLRATVADRDNRLNSYELTAEQAKLVEEFRKTLKADKDDVFDWGTLSFSKPKKSEEK